MAKSFLQTINPFTFGTNRGLQIRNGRIQTVQNVMGQIQQISNNYSPEAVAPFVAHRRFVADTFTRMFLQFIYTDNDGVRQPASSLDDDAGNQIYEGFARMASEPNPRDNHCNFWQSVIYDGLTNGTAYACFFVEPKFALGGFLLGARNPALYHIPSSNVVEELDDNGEWKYTIQAPNNESFVFEGASAQRILRFSNKTIAGVKPSRDYQKAFMNYYLTMNYSQEFLGKGGMRNLLLKLSGGQELGDAEVQELEKTVQESIKTGSTMILNGGDYGVLHQDAKSPKDEVLTEAMIQARADVCAVLGVNEALLGYGADKKVGNDLQESYQHFLGNIEPFICTIEQELEKKCIRPFNNTDEIIRFVFNRKILEMVTPSQRAEIFAKYAGQANGAGIYTINELRREINLPPVTDGDRIVRPIDKAMDTATSTESE